jgi:hypothetical protein
MCPAKLYKPHPVVAGPPVAPGKSASPALRYDLHTWKPCSDAIIAVSVNFFTKKHRNASSIQNEHWRKVSTRLEATITLLLNWKHR